MSDIVIDLIVNARFGFSPQPFIWRVRTGSADNPIRSNTRASGDTPQ
jgi:hypothetical protein